MRSGGLSLSRWSKRRPSPGSTAWAGRSATAPTSRRASPPPSAPPTAGRPRRPPARGAAPAQPHAPARGARRGASASSRIPSPRRSSRRNHALHRLLVNGVRRRVPRDDGTIGQRQAPRPRLRRARRERLARRQPVHRDRRTSTAPPDIVCSSTACRCGHRAQERRRRERDDLDGVPAAPDLQGADPRALRLQRRCSSSPTACRPASARSPPTASASCPGAPSTGEALAPDDASPSSRCCSTACSSKRRSSTSLRYFIVFEERRRRRLGRRWPGTTSSTP